MKRKRNVLETKPRTPSGLRRWLLAAIERVDDIEERGDLGAPDPEPEDFYRIERLVEEAGNHAATLGWDDLFRVSRELTNGEAVSGHRFPFWALMENTRSFFGKCLARCTESKREEKQRDKEFYTPPELARQWGRSKNTIRNWIKAGKLRADNASEPGKQPRYHIKREDAEAFREANCTTEQQPERPTPRRQAAYWGEFEEIV